MSKKHTGPGGITEDKSKILKEFLDKARTLAKKYDDDDGDLVDSLFDKVVELVTEAARNKNRSDIVQFQVRLSNLKSANVAPLQAVLSGEGNAITLKIIDEAISTVNTFYEHSRGLLKKTAAGAGNIVQNKFDSIVHTAKHALRPDNIIKEAFEFNPLISMGVDFVTEQIHSAKEKKKELNNSLSSDVREVIPRPKKQRSYSDSNTVPKAKPKSKTGTEPLARISPPEEMPNSESLTPEAAADEKYGAIPSGESPEEASNKADFLKGLKEGIDSELQRIDPSGFLGGMVEGMIDEFQKMSSEPAQDNIGSQEIEKILIRIDDDLIEIYDTASNSEKLLEKLVGFGKDTADSNKTMASLEQKKDTEKEIADLSKPESNLAAPLIGAAVTKKPHDTIFDKLTKTFTDFGKEKTENITQSVLQGTVLGSIITGTVAALPIVGIVAAAAATLGLGYTFRKELLDFTFGPLKDVKRRFENKQKTFKTDWLTTAEVSWADTITKYLGHGTFGKQIYGMSLVKNQYGEDVALSLASSDMGRKVLEEVGKSGNADTVIQRFRKQINERVQDDPRTDIFSGSGNGSEKVRNVQAIKPALDAIADRQSSKTKIAQRIRATFPSNPREARFARQNLAVLDKYKDIIESASARTGVDPDFLKAIILKESSGNPNAIGDGGKAVGLGQLHPGAAGDAGISPNERFDPTKNINATATHIAQLGKEWNWNYPDMAAAYNRGTGGWRGQGKDPQADLVHGTNYQRGLGQILAGIRLQEQQTNLDNTKDSRQKVAGGGQTLNNQSIDNSSKQSTIINYGTEQGETASLYSWLMNMYSPARPPS